MQALTIVVKDLQSVAKDQNNDTKDPESVAKDQYDVQQNY